MRTALIFIIVVLIACKGTNNFYQGRLSDINLNPIAGVMVTERYSRYQTQTDSNGYFKLDRQSDDLGELIFTKEGYRTDTIHTIFHRGGEQIGYRFIENDTTLVYLTKLDALGKIK